ncbi:MAG: two-component system sensor histidine kinase NtrB [Pseudomonadota bacterium]
MGGASNAKPQAPLGGPSVSHLLNALPDPVILVDSGNAIAYANAAAEQFFLVSAALLHARRLNEVIAATSPLLALVDEARSRDGSFAEYDLDLARASGERQVVDVRVSPVPDYPGYVLIRLEPRGIAEKFNRQMTHRGAARSVAGVAAMLAHEIKNPLSGIRGAAQLLADTVAPPDSGLADLICKEADRITALVNSMEVFSDSRPPQRRAENIHAILDHVIALVRASAADGLIIHQRYDPSLPPVLGNADQLVQVFLNLMKNAAEAVLSEGGEITIATAFSHGMRIAVAGSAQRVTLPIEVQVIDSGGGVPNDVKAHLFEPFVSTKPNGKGLGLALVAKLVGDHGGFIDCESQPGRTVFRVLLPMGTE